MTTSQIVRLEMSLTSVNIYELWFLKNKLMHITTCQFASVQIFL